MPVKVVIRKVMDMDSLTRLNEAVAYIEAHLTEEIDLKEAARIAYCSDYHFKRMFSFLAGVSLSEYMLLQEPFSKCTASHHPRRGKVVKS